jgi:hypothetical protein
MFMVAFMFMTKHNDIEQKIHHQKLSQKLIVIFFFFFVLALSKAPAAVAVTDEKGKVD